MPRVIGNELADATSCKDCSLGRTAIYHGVIQKNPQLVRDCRTHVIQYGPGRVILRQDQIPTVIYTVYAGWLYSYRKLTNDRQQVISFIIPGDTITFSSIFVPGTRLAYGVKSITNVELCAFDSARFRHQVGEDATFSGPYRSALSQHVNSLHRRIADIGQRSAKGQVAQLLLELLERHEDRGLAEGREFMFPVSQELLAKALGMTKAYINRTLSAFKSCGVIQLQSRRLKIIDLDLLKAFAENE